MARKSSKTDLFRELTWDDLREWAGDTIVSRGRNYQRNSQVEGLARTPSGGVIAWVHGAKRYTTWVDFEEGALASACSCPYGATCKHAVAVVLEYLDHLKNDIAIAEKRPDDVIRWYDKHEPKGMGGWWSGSYDDKVAGALVDHYPDRALGIWKKLAETEIALAKPKAYGAAAGYLRKAHRVLKKLGREKEWQGYLA